MPRQSSRLPPTSPRSCRSGRLGSCPDRDDPQSMTDVELLAFLLGPGQPMPLATAERLLAGRCLSRLLARPAIDLRHLGASGAGAANLTAAYELARRLAAQDLKGLPILFSTPALLAHYLALHHATTDQEVFGAVYVDARHRLISDREFFRGTLHRSSVDPLPVLKEALLRDASGIALYHNHPSGDPTPSPEDLFVTRRMCDACDLLGFELLDHLIVTCDGRWTSLRQSRSW
jgi:DNA repair protein RadC